MDDTGVIKINMLYDDTDSIVQHWNLSVNTSSAYYINMMRCS